MRPDVSGSGTGWRHREVSNGRRNISRGLGLPRGSGAGPDVGHADPDTCRSVDTEQLERQRIRSVLGPGCCHGDRGGDGQTYPPTADATESGNLGKKIIRLPARRVA